MTIAKLSSESRIEIPAEILRQLGLQPGDTVQLDVDGERIVLTKQDPHAALQRLRELGTGRWREIEEEIERSRAEWDEYSKEIERLRTDEAT